MNIFFWCIYIPLFQALCLSAKAGLVLFLEVPKRGQLRFWPHHISISIIRHFRFEAGSISKAFSEIYMYKLLATTKGTPQKGLCGPRLNLGPWFLVLAFISRK